MAEQRRAHWLRKNAAARMPRRMIVLDSEAYRHRAVGNERHDFRCAVASFDTLDVNAQPEGIPLWLETECAATLWSFVADFTSTAHRTVLFAHNLSYDLRLTEGLRHLPGLGYKCSGMALTSHGCWARFGKGAQSLWLIDSLSFIPAALAKVGALVGMEKPSLPSDDGTNAEWLHRCRSDVEITREGMLRILGYLKKNDLGDFRLTGSAQCTAAYRHKFLPDRTLLVHADEEALEAERRAAWSGRAEVWTHGEVNKPIYEMDYETAYARIAYNIQVPVKLVTDHSGIPWNRLTQVMEHYAVLADVTIRTESPCVPASHNNGIVWPVGDFQTTLWDHELRLAKREGAEIEVHKYWYYKRQPILRDWAAWILRSLSLPASELDPVVKLMLKDWSRALIGRFGLRYSVLEEIGTTPNHDLCLRGVWDADTKTELEYLQIGSQLLERMARVESPNSTPAVMSAVMSAARVNLWGAMKHAGEENIYYVDTDGFLCSSAGYRSVDKAQRRGLLPTMRLKSQYQGGDFRSPRNIDLGETRRVSGAPKLAERLEPGVYRGEVWESLPTALKRKHIGNVFIHERTFNISDTDKRRRHLPGGRTEAIRLPLDSMTA